MEGVSKRTFKEERDMEKSGQMIIRRTQNGARAEEEKVESCQKDAKRVD